MSEETPERFRIENAKLQKEIDRPTAELKAKDEQIEQMRNALRELYDWQNGPPLIRDKKEWEHAMELAGEALKGGTDG